jgi:hypothetical protein
LNGTHFSDNGSHNIQAKVEMREVGEKLAHTLSSNHGSFVLFLVRSFSRFSYQKSLELEEYILHGDL